MRVVVTFFGIGHNRQPTLHGSRCLLELLSEEVAVTHPEAQAYNEGVFAVLALARNTADRLAPRYPETRLGVAIGALDGLAADEGARLLRPVER